MYKIVPGRTKSDSLGYRILRTNMAVNGASNSKVGATFHFLDVPSTKQHPNAASS